jgi:hypothetical protein
VPQDLPLDFPALCQYVGHLFLTSRHQAELAARECADLRARLAAAERDRDAALRLLPRGAPADGGPAHE